ncbi:queuosine salvage protein-like [Nylanderia fulva]|uniref:queuosine salvage protein-like n=1 Tax=Nylanderia fulva TaxID=613905 RepID=UPI0010FB8A3D|nr:queuosine salvage protein-like [Nylanderia fulva]XP_029177679.1 queuosine salvage protein-like [Nylanderia fulva]
MESHLLQKITQSMLKRIFRSDDGKTHIPLLRERCKILHAVGKVLVEKYKGTFVECVKSCNYNSDKLRKLLFDEFEPYRDEAIYESKKVRLFTKANSLVSDIWACYRKTNLFQLNIHNIMSTIFIDYRSPIVLHHLRILDYSNRLLNKFKDSDEPLKHRSREELEIRGCSLHAVNLLYYFLIQKKVPPQNPRCFLFIALTPELMQGCKILIDNYLYKLLADKIDTGCINDEPFHYITSTHY